MKINTLVLSGGGLLGICYCGILKHLEELHSKQIIKLDIKRIIGNSIGTIFGLLYIIGYDSKQLRQEILEKKLSELTKINISKLFSEYGIDTGENVMSWLETLLLKKGYTKYTTFYELYTKTNIFFQVVTTNLNNYTKEIFDYTTFPELPVLDAVRFSITLPFIFTCNKLNDTIYVDGVLTCNYPITLVDDSDLPNTLGIRLNNKDINSNFHIEGLTDYMYKILSCFKRDNIINILNKYDKNTIFVKNDDIKTINLMNFNISTKLKIKLINIGYKSSFLYFINTLDDNKQFSY